MSYFLSNKFKGAFFGALAMQKPVIQNQESRGNFARQELLDWKQKWLLFLDREVVPAIPDREKLLNIWWKTIFDDFDLLSRENSASEISCSVFALSILPVVVYYHDYWHYLSEFVIQKGKKLQKSQTEINNVLVWCYTLRLALRGDLITDNMTASDAVEKQALANLWGEFSKRVVKGTKIQQKSVILWLEKLELFFLKGLSLEELLKYLSLTNDWEIALSLFCFFNNPQDFDLAIKQALFLEKNFVGASALSGILSGAYNGLTGIPISWRNSCHDRHFYQQLTVQIEEMTDEWLGISTQKNAMDNSSVITAPQIVQSRSSLQIISQQEYQ